MKPRTSTPPNMKPMNRHYRKAKEMYDGYNEFFNDKLDGKLEFNIKGLPKRFQDANLTYALNIPPYFKRKGILLKRKNEPSTYYFCDEVVTKDLKVHIPYKVFEDFLRERTERNKVRYKELKYGKHEEPSKDEEKLLKETRNLAYIALGVSIISLLLKLIF